MRDLTKGVIITIVGAVVCREFYARGYNKGGKDVIERLDLMVKVKDAVENQGKEES